jgi:drug/metabolite transporter (DMT)-like permease
MTSRVSAIEIDATGWAKCAYSIEFNATGRTPLKTFLTTTFALVAFALNSILCRLALRGGEADAAGFTAVRLASGALALIAISYFVSRKNGVKKSGSWTSALFLFAYAACFSFAYLGLTAGTGALILFGAVQLTMIAAAVGKGERPPFWEWCGLAVAAGGLVYLVLPGLASPPLASSALMGAAGISWGIYTLRGRSGKDPLANTTGNFVRSLPLVAILAALFYSDLHLTARGILLAGLSGAAASGAGYTVWYIALRDHTSARAAILQLSVPVIAAFLGVLLLDEATTPRLYVAASLILGGIALTIFGRKR